MRSCINSHDLISLMRGQCVGMSCLSVGRACRMEELELHHCRKSTTDSLGNTNQKRSDCGACFPEKRRENFFAVA
ncbi:hypothetical protein PGIN_AFR-5B1_00758 [Porphyromonas gingivalis]|nr:hypothetical protein PGIN_AFR-5B1_00758 [Porphyromonas gingivalis]